MVRPKGTDLHYEVELALVMGKQVRDLDKNDEKGALDAIESSCIPFEDISSCKFEGQSLI